MGRFEEPGDEDLRGIGARVSDVANPLTSEDLRLIQLASAYGGTQRKIEEVMGVQRRTIDRLLKAELMGWMREAKEIADR
jgi:hypothetical protein